MSGISDSVKGYNIFGRYRFYSHFPMRNLIRYHCEGTIDTSDFDSLELKEYDMMRRAMSFMSAELEVQTGKWITFFGVISVQVLTPLLVDLCQRIHIGGMEYLCIFEIIK